MQGEIHGLTRAYMVAALKRSKYRTEASDYLAFATLAGLALTLRALRR